MMKRMKHLPAVALTLLWFSVACRHAPLPPTPLSDRQNDSLALVDLYHATAGPRWARPWALSAPMTQWQGVTLAQGRVTQLNLAGNRLAGAVPESFGNLTALQYCDVSENQLTGALPASLDRLTQLAYLDLSTNQLAGAFPALGRLDGLVVLDGSVNAFTSLPDLSGLATLQYLAFGKNRLAGRLPAEWSALAALIYLDVSGNDFSGEVPVDWSTLVSLQAFYLYRNRLSGPLPACIGHYTALRTLAIDENNLSGALPEALGLLPALEELWLSHNRLSGVIPASLRHHPRWSEWQPFLCPQQSGYGFSDCSSGGFSATGKTSTQSVIVNGRRYKFVNKVMIFIN
jgi:hypothetical protein